MPVAAGDHLQLDTATAEDLHLFDPDPEANSLFSFCDRCRTDGGQRVLARRMRAPWSEGERIRATQNAIAAIFAQRETFAGLPSSFLASSVERYTNEGLPIVRERNTIEFGMGAFSIWSSQDRFYSRITRGVELTCRLLRTLREFLAQAQQDRSAAQTQDSELQPLFDELTSLLALPGLNSIPDADSERWFWQTLRADQVFRLYEKDAVERLLQIVYEIDALVAMADVSSTAGWMLPDILDGPARVNAQGLTHPLLPDAIANPVTLDQDHRVLFLTGPNMAGKTTYLRAVATAVYLAHLGMGVPAQHFEFAPVQSLLTAISLSDDLNDGISYFRAEALRVKAVAEAVGAGRRVIAIMDEPFKGTNVKDAFDASLAILQRFATKPDCLFMVSSHLIELSEQLDATLPIDYRFFEAEEGSNRLRFDYVLHSGVSSQRLGMRVLSEEGIFTLLDDHPDS